MITNPLYTIDCKSWGFVHENIRIHYVMQITEHKWEMNTLVAIHTFKSEKCYICCVRVI